MAESSSAMSVRAPNGLTNQAMCLAKRDIRRPARPGWCIDEREATRPRVAVTVMSHAASIELSLDAAVSQINSWVAEIDEAGCGPHDMSCHRPYDE